MIYSIQHSGYMFNWNCMSISIKPLGYNRILSNDDYHCTNAWAKIDQHQSCIHAALLQHSVLSISSPSLPYALWQPAHCSIAHRVLCVDTKCFSYFATKRNNIRTTNIMHFTAVTFKTFQHYLLLLLFVCLFWILFEFFFFCLF